jgi:hypothetical protein
MAAIDVMNLRMDVTLEASLLSLVRTESLNPALDLNSLWCMFKGSVLAIFLSGVILRFFSSRTTFA